MMSSELGIHVRLLGGFRVERTGSEREVSDWQRRSAKSLTKLLAAHTGHALHREQILDTLWPGIAVESALNSFGKALHAARHALEPELPRREDSAYLHLMDGMLVLNSERVVVDTDRFEQLAEAALRRGDIDDYEAALAVYGGELLPEDRYESWCAERRNSLAELHVRLLLGVAEALGKRGDCDKSAGYLREVLRLEPTREAAHRRLMSLYAQMGTPERAVRQFQLCEDVLRQELDLAPQQETIALYHDVLGRRNLRQSSVPEPDREPLDQGRPSAASGGSTVRGPFLGRKRVLQRLSQQLTRSDDRRAGMIVISGEAGVGKTRLLEEFAIQASDQGALTLWAGRGAHAKQFACGPFAVALEGYAASRSEAERRELARCYLALVRFVPSLAAVSDLSMVAADPGASHVDLISAIVRLLTDLARTRPVLIVLGDLHGTDRASLDLVRYLAHLAVWQPWLMVGAVRDEELETDTELRQMVETMTRAHLCLGIDLQCLSRRSCDQFVQATLPSACLDGNLLETIYVRSRGNPLFIGELVREIRRGGPTRALAEWREESQVAEQAPALARTQMAMRLAAMDETLRRVLGLAAAAGETEISLSQLRIGAAALEPPVPVAALFDALDRALQMRLLEEGRTGLAFRHPFVRSAMYDCLPRHRRDEFHSAIAAHLGRVPQGHRRLPSSGSRRRQPSHVAHSLEDDRKSAGIPTAHDEAERYALPSRQTRSSLKRSRVT
jgi:DNA-binding SARP family transcriptional activator